MLAEMVSIIKEQRNQRYYKEMNIASVIIKS